MTKLNKKITNRLISGIKKFRTILANAKAKDINESDTVMIIIDMLYYVFGYDKYSEITSEHAIRGTYCDLAIILKGKLEILIEAKAIGLDLKDSYVKQAVDYAANQGVDWVILTNGIIWRVYKVTFGKPIDQELVIEFDFLNLSHKKKQDIECLFFLSKEGWAKSAIESYQEQKQALSRFYLGAILLSDPVVNVVKRELKKISPDIKIQPEQIKDAISLEVLKREVVEGEKADEARKKIQRSIRSKQHKKSKKKVKAAVRSQSDSKLSSSDSVDKIRTLEN